MWTTLHQGDEADDSDHDSDEDDNNYGHDSDTDELLLTCAFTDALPLPIRTLKGRVVCVSCACRVVCGVGECLHGKA